MASQSLGASRPISHEAGALQLRATLPLPAVALFSVGAPGAVAGAVGVAERSFEGSPSPTPLTALTS